MLIHEISFGLFNLSHMKLICGWHHGWKMLFVLLVYHHHWPDHWGQPGSLQLEQLVSWCSQTSLELNPLKNVDMTMDFRRTPIPLPYLLSSITWCLPWTLSGFSWELKQSLHTQVSFTQIRQGALRSAANSIADWTVKPPPSQICPSVFSY